MAFTIFTDVCSNLPGRILREMDIHTVSGSYMLDGKTYTYNGDIESFDYGTFYGMLRDGKLVSSTLINTQAFIEAFTPELQAGNDIVYVGMSSAVSGTFNSARIAANELMESFPGRTVRVVDSRGASLGVGLLACMCGDLRAEGLDVNETADKVNDATDRLCSYFTVDNLMFLCRTGRISSISAAAGTLLHIKPLLWGDEGGHIVDCAKFVGRKRAINSIIEKYAAKVVNASEQRVAISHGDCLDEANMLAEKITKIAPPREIIICPHEPVTGSHVGPGMLALYFFGDSR